MVGYNFNGIGEVWSPAATFRSCSAPSGVALPRVTEQSATQLAFEWQEPADSGGCPTTGFELFLDDKDTGLIVSAYAGPPHVKSAAITLDPTHLGESYRFLLQATNAIGTGSSVVGHALYAAVPAAPADGPASDAAITSRERIRVTWAASEGGDTGGSEILSYQLQMDDGDGGDFQELTGGEGVQYLKLSYTVSAGVAEGVTFRFRFRARNAVGWSDYSPITYIEAASTPGRPTAPRLAAAAATGVTLSLSPSSEDGGNAITGYRIFRDDGALLSAISYDFELEGYDGSSSSYEATIVDEGLTLGSIYRFVLAATNAYGDSAFSQHLVAGVGAPPEVTEAPLRDEAYDRFDQASGLVAMMITWEGHTVTADLPVLGYQLLVDDGLGNDAQFRVVYDSGFNPLGTKALVEGLTASLPYRFQVKARDINGLGPTSPAASFVACLSPANLAAPVLLDVSKSSFEVSWLRPSSNGGCPITEFALFLSED